MKQIQHYVLCKQDVTIYIATKHIPNQECYTIQKNIIIRDKLVEECNIEIYDLHLFMIRLIDMLREYINSGYAFSKFEIKMEE